MLQKTLQNFLQEQENDYCHNAGTASLLSYFSEDLPWPANEQLPSLVLFAQWYVSFFLILSVRDLTQKIAHNN